MTSRQTGRPIEDGGYADKIKSLNFKIDPEFKREFKSFVVSQGMGVTDLFKEGFPLSKKRQK